MRAWIVSWGAFVAACGSAAAPDPATPVEAEVTTVEGQTVREIVREPSSHDAGPSTAAGGDAAPSPDRTESTDPPSSWLSCDMPPSVDRQIRSLLQKAHPAPLRIVRWLLFDHGDGRGTAYTVYEQSRHEACQALSRASRTTKRRSEARARFENECQAQSSVPMERCKYAGLARFSIREMPPAGVSDATPRVEMTEDEVLDPELCTYRFVLFALRELDGEPDPEIIVEFEWQDLVSGPPDGPEPTKKVHALLVFRSDLSVQESRTIGVEYFQEGEFAPEAPTRGSYRFEDVGRDGYFDLLIRKETVEHCRGCRSSTERLVLRYDADRDAWR